MGRRAAFAPLLCLAACNGLFYHPSREPVDPAGMEPRPEDVEIRTADGLGLRGWLFPAKAEPRGLIVQFHGNGGNRASACASLLWVTGAGYELLAFDYRGYGDSPGEPSAEGLNADAVAAIAFALKKAGGARVVLYGESLGGAVLLRALADVPDRSGIRAVVVEGTFSSYQAVARERLAGSWATWLFQPLAWLLISDAYRPEEAIPGVSPLPLLVIHGERDRHVPIGMGLDVYARANEPKTLWRVEGGRHIDTYRREGGRHRARLLDYLESLPPR